MAEYDDINSYRAAVERVKGAFEQRIRKFLTTTRQAFIDAGYNVSDIDDMSDECYSWSFAIILTNTELVEENEYIDFRFEIAESLAFDGTTDGINFSINIVASGGEIVGGCTPYNYTPDVWVDMHDADAIEERFRMVESLHPDDAIETVKKFLDK
jgi:hypothetical protein